MSINNKYVKVEKFEEETRDEGFQAVQVQDNFVYKGKVIEIPESPVYVDNHKIEVGDVVLFAKYSPDTHEITEKGKTVKFVRAEDLLEVL